MKVIDREYQPIGVAQHRPCWFLYLECGHVKNVNANTSNYARAEVVQHVKCPVCQSPMKKRCSSAKELQNFAEFIIKHDL